MTAPDIIPGDAPSYQLCKTLYSYHPLGAKLVDFPIQMAQSMPREIAVPKGPEDRLVEAFLAEWAALGADRNIANLGRQAFIYGASTLALVGDASDPATPVQFEKLAQKASLTFNVLDPLNTAGSLVLNQDPNAVDYQKVAQVAVAGKVYNRSRTVTLFNEDPIYIEYTSSAFGYVGRSVFQRSLFQLKSFILTLITDNMIALKAGVLIIKLKQQSSAIDRLASAFNAQKRDMVKEAQTGNSINVGAEDSIESLNLQNLDGAYGMARKNILENIASASGRPAKIVMAETFAEGFGEGTEDAKHVAQYIDGVREWLGPAYQFMDRIAQRRAWSPEFYKTIQADFPEYKDVDYKTAFYTWSNSFKATWPSLLKEPESELVEVDKVKLEGISSVSQILLPIADPTNKAIIAQWMTDNLNSLKRLFSSPLNLDVEALAAHAEEMAAQASAAAEGGGEGDDEDKIPPPSGPKGV